MTLVVNNAEGGTNGVAVSTANSGGASGTAFSSVLTGAGSSIKFDSTQQAHGAMSYRLVQAASSCLVTLTAAAAHVSYAARVYIRFNTLPTPNGQIFLEIIGGGAAIALRNTNQFSIEDQNGSKKIFSGTIAVGTWYRLEVETTSAGLGASYLAGRYFLGDSTTPVDSYSSNTANTGAVANTAIRSGAEINLGANNDLWIDDLAVVDGSTTPIGPAGLNRRWLIEDYAETLTRTDLQRRLIEDYAEIAAQTGGPRTLVEDYAEVVTVWQKIRLLSEVYGEVVTPAVYPILAPPSGGSWS